MGQYLYGIKSEDFNPPHIPSGSKVLDIGAGNGEITKKLMRMAGDGNVFAIEPGIEYNLEDLSKLLDREHIFPKTLQEAIKEHSEKLIQQFDVVTVFKYNIPYNQKEEFIKDLSQTIKPDGVVYITSVEYSKINLMPHHGEAPYIMDVLNGHFKNVDVEIIKHPVQGYNQYALITCRNPIDFK